ncbi:Preprotein translocase subunit SecB (SecB) (PDB:1OZB) [Commensalibacter communis]|uniref:Protein-export protein SecB n=1 Tax=Commensalibacter communis TaxID=2972786 RepID=A0A9W4X9W7_9PROT|nr:protein-export chaperone SecB [Commensalibacter communis]CAI3922690.1 Preprotein translocase subunit SecB (SecB) (PDB:1OZB) [Commensalibacter communis]CAI3923089.1 Preprotein translocase subunit SecB (SecB) (PDB:1OZB) [Commensalibacter communis]CAI3935258.1 Preprotein translocase subunit SecB (SecB) (PDB:1OZB) [Commensalibacter communis]CAI3944900.1 Preprotein translocase subunit SecB (SecB) (PDB:1OZB) [Commensalibacter communis]CAI3946334.1 Preprotein translocase subunit SecB (SecB) (PDB:1
MSDTMNNLSDAHLEEAPPPLPLTLNIQFTKDLSFEVPHGASIFATLEDAPQISVAIDANANRLSEENVYEVSLTLKVEATESPREDQTQPRIVFVTELVYCAVVSLNNPPEELIEPILLVEVPRLIFPYARNIIGDVTRDGGFPPVILQPIDFVSLWQNKQAQQAAQTQTEAGHA